MCTLFINVSHRLALINMVILHDEDYYVSRIPQPDLGPLRNFLRFIWDQERKAFLGRTAKEWGNVHKHLIEI